MVKRCKEGLFSQLEVNRGLPAVSLMRHFQRDRTEWRIDSGLRKMVDVRNANLVSPSSLPAMGGGGIDLVMIRNVLIYFDDATKAKILSDIRVRMKRDSYLLLGSSEVTTGASAGFVRHQIGKTIFFRPS
jgi:chemotaxis protein methyltransferase CheR